VVFVHINIKPLKKYTSNIWGFHSSKFPHCVLVIMPCSLVTDGCQHFVGIHCPDLQGEPWCTLSNKNLLAWNFLSPELEVTCGTDAIIIQVVLLFPYLHIGVSLSSIHYNQSHHIYINQRQRYICLIWNKNIN